MHLAELRQSFASVSQKDAQCQWEPQKHAVAKRTASEQSIAEADAHHSSMLNRLTGLRHVDSLNDSKSSLTRPPSLKRPSGSPRLFVSDFGPKSDCSDPLPTNGASRPVADPAVPQLIVTAPRSNPQSRRAETLQTHPDTNDVRANRPAPATAPAPVVNVSAAGDAAKSATFDIDTVFDKRPLCASQCVDEPPKPEANSFPSQTQVHTQTQTPTENSAKQTSSNYLKEQIISFFQPSDNKLAMKLFGNRNALMKEKLRQQQSGFRFIIHPCSSFRFYWDLVMLICLNVNVIVLPVIIAYFNDDLDSHWLIFNSISDALFIVDIVTNFRTGVITNDYAEQIVLNPRQIALHYIRTWFFLDVVSTIPMDYLFLLVHDDTDDQVRTAHLMHAGRALRILRLAKLLSLLRLLRFSRVVRYVTQWEEFLNIAKMVIRVFNLVLLILLLAHWQACLQFLIPSLNDFPPDCWVTIEELVDAPWISQYTWSVFRAMSHMLSIGYGRIPPQSTSDAWMTMGSMLTGAICYAMFVGHASALIQSFDTSRRLYREKWKQVEEYMAFRKFPRSLRERISSYYEHRYQGKMFNEDAILCELSECLKQQIVNYNCRALVAAVPFFSNADPDFVTQVVTKLKFEVYQPGDVVIKEGTIGTKMYFIQEGIVDIITKDGEVATSLSDGSYFGEICLLTNARRVASVRTVTYCNLYSLSKDHFNEVLDEYPLMRRTMEMIAAERLHKIGETTQQLAISRSQTDLDADASVVKEIVNRVLEEDQSSANARSFEEDEDETEDSSTDSMSPQSTAEFTLQRSSSSRKQRQKNRQHKMKLNIPLLNRSRRGSQTSLGKLKHDKSNNALSSK